MNSDPQKTQKKRRLPPWLKKRLPAGGETARVHRLLEDLHLATVCAEAHCPNLAECYARGTATFLILGETCTRSCGFCAIGSAGLRPVHSEPEDKNPPGKTDTGETFTRTSPVLPLREDEPGAVAEACRRMGLRHVVITSVTRDDLHDGGAEHFAGTIRAVRGELPDAVIEVLTPDFLGSTDAIDVVLQARPDIFNHNVETVPRMYPAVRPQADYQRSLDVLEYAGKNSPAERKLYTKSGIMVGLGERSDEVTQVMRDLRSVGCDILTIGQYLAPSDEHLPVERFAAPEEFDAWKAEAEEMGFVSVASGPFVRSSYHAEQVFENRSR